VQDTILPGTSTWSYRVQRKAGFLKGALPLIGANFPKYLAAMVVQSNGATGCRALLSFGDEMPAHVEGSSLDFNEANDFIPW